MSVFAVISARQVDKHLQIWKSKTLIKLKHIYIISNSKIGFVITEKSSSPFIAIASLECFLSCKMFSKINFETELLNQI